MTVRVERSNLGKASKQEDITQIVEEGILFIITTDAKIDKDKLREILESVSGSLTLGAAKNIDQNVFFPIINGNKSEHRSSHVECDDKFMEVNKSNESMMLDRMAKSITNSSKKMLHLKRLNVQAVQAYTHDSRLQAAGEKYVIR